MADLKFHPVCHDHKAFLEKASKRSGFNEAHEALELEYGLAHEMLAARTRAWSPPASYALGGFAQALCRGCRMYAKKSNWFL